MTFGLEEYELGLLTLFMLLIPSALYALGMMEGKTGRYAFRAAVFLHLASIVQRWLVTGGPPLAEKHDNISFMALGAALAYSYFSKGRSVRGLSTFALPLISVLLLVSAGHRTINTVSPFMNTPWFYLHVFFFFLSFGFFGVAACIGISYLMDGRWEHEVLQYKGIVHGWIMLSLSLFAGSIWFYTAYGTYWLWTSKELWITITWLFYGMYLHARYIGGIRGKAASLIGCVAFAVALFSYFGVGTIIKAPPSQF